MKKGRTKWIVIVLVLIVALIVGWQLLGNKAGTMYAQETATTGNLTTYYNFSGTLDVNRSVVITAMTQTTVSEIYVLPNSMVLKNARLMRLEDGTILKADIAGEVTNIAVTVDNQVNVGDTLMEIMDFSSLKATFDVDEYDVSAIQIGKTAQITVDGGESTFEGKISAINKRATKSGDLNYYSATIDLNGVALPEGTLPGMQVTVKVLNQQVENVVLLKVDAVSFTAQNTPYVLLPDGKTTKQQVVTVGVNDGTQVEITQGLKSGDTVLYTPTSTESFTTVMGARRYGQ